MSVYSRKGESLFDKKVYTECNIFECVDSKDQNEHKSWQYKNVKARSFFVNL